MTNAEYHASGAVTKSVLDLVHKSPALYQYRKEHPQEATENMLLGSVVHKLVLEPEDFENEFAVLPEIDRRTKAGKDAYSDFTAGLVDGVVIVPQATYNTATAMKNAVLAHPIARMLLEAGKAEQSFFWERDGIKCACRPDWLRDDGLVVDLKTTKSAAPDDFQKSAYNFRYYVQAWWYLDGLQRCGVNAEQFVFIAVESSPPYNVCAFAADDLFFDLGRIEAEQDFETYKQCITSGAWYGYDKEPEVHSLSVPDYIARRMEL